jgi:hypothetical protein
MGLKWTKPKKTKKKDGSGELIIANATIPDRGQPGADELWTLWRTKKDLLKADGFSIKKDVMYGGKWVVTYYHNVTAESMEKPAGGGGKMNWLIDFNAKVDKYKKIISNISAALKTDGDADAGLPRDNRRVQPRRNAPERRGTGGITADDLDGFDNSWGGGGGGSDTSVSAEQLALEMGGLEVDLDLL